MGWDKIKRYEYLFPRASISRFSRAFHNLLTDEGGGGRGLFVCREIFLGGGGGRGGGAIEHLCFVVFLRLRSFTPPFPFMISTPKL